MKDFLIVGSALFRECFERFRVFAHEFLPRLQLRFDRGVIRREQITFRGFDRAEVSPLRTLSRASISSGMTAPVDVPMAISLRAVMVAAPPVRTHYDVRGSSAS